MAEWQVKQILEKKVKADKIVTLLLQNRKLIKKKEIEEFFQPLRPEALTAKNLALSSRSLSRGISRIKKAIDNQELIVVYGDYDADGVCAAAILWETLHCLGGKAMPFIPLRQEEGYGLSLAGLQRIKKELGPVKLIITVDNGITAFKAAAAAKKQGIDLIITDHHLPGKKKPAAAAIIHTTKLSGAGVAWFFSRELNRRLRPRSGATNPLRGRIEELAAIGTVADMMPLVGPNRSLVKYGLEKLKKTQRPGLLALFQEARLETKTFTPWQISFLIAPRLNAMGRLADAMDALRLLCTPDRVRAKSLVQKLNQENARRQRLTEQATRHAQKIFVKPWPKLLFVSSPDYHEGVIGLVAGDLVRKCQRPAFVFSVGKKLAKGSARSIEGFNLIQAIGQCENLLVGYGGHPLAAGLTVEKSKLALLKKRLTVIAEKKLKDKQLTPILKIDCQLRLFHLTWKLYEGMEKLAPFGLANSKPVFCSRGLRVTNQRTVGNNGKHLKLRLDDPRTPKIETMLAFEENQSLEAIGFGMGDLAAKIKPGDLIDIAYTLENNSWRDTEKLELKIKDLHLGGVS